MTGFRALLAFDARLLLKRALFRTVAAASILASALAALGGSADDAEVDAGAWRALSQAVRVVVPLLLAFGAVLGAVSLAGDAASGSLRAVLVRPVSRTGVVLSRAVVLALALTAVYVASILVALLCAMTTGPFAAITSKLAEFAPPVVPLDDLVRTTPVLIALGIPAIVCATMIGLMLSAWSNDPALSAVCALLAVLSPYLAEILLIASSSWMFTHGAVFGASVLSQLASGDTTRLALASTWRDLMAPVLVPIGAAVVAVAAACVVFTRRDFRG